ncbi:MAG TPA: transcription antitermination factor NusB [Thermoanaerobaculia bacterium]|nr:transcription antitermination factor NusB [Thermoanaerobaculia bacterium]
MTASKGNGTAPRPRRRQAPRAGRRRQAREMAVQMLYQWELGRSSLQEIFRSFDLYHYGAETSSRKIEQGSPEAFDLACRLVQGTVDSREEIDRHIAEQAENWRIERMPDVDRNILRLAIYEYLADPELPKVVAIDEAIELAKKFGSEKSGKFVNGLLDPLLSSAALADARRAGDLIPQRAGRVEGIS